MDYPIEAGCRVVRDPARRPSFQQDQGVPKQAFGEGEINSLVLLARPALALWNDAVLFRVFMAARPAFL